MYIRAVELSMMPRSLDSLSFRSDSIRIRARAAPVSKAIASRAVQAKDGMDATL